MIRRIPVQEAVGKILSHDITEIRPGEFKGAAFTKGHRIREMDICHLQRLGKQFVHILKIDNDHMHEDEAAVALAKAFSGPGVCWSGQPREGKLKLVAEKDGILSVNTGQLTEINLLGEIMCACRHNHSVVRKGDVVAATRAIPLVIKKEVVERAASLASGGLFRVKAMRKPRAGIVITGNEVYSALIEDRFEPILRRKITAVGGCCIGVFFAPDNPEIIRDKIYSLLEAGADLILTSGGMSVDPDDVTRQGIALAGAHDMIYGAAVLPGAMFLIATIGKVPVMGIPACGIYHETTVFDLILPRILAGERIGRRQLAELGHGGLCLDCSDCRFPRCPFGKC